jgi:hypothetical protein
MKPLLSATLVMLPTIFTVWISRQGSPLSRTGIAQNVLWAQASLDSKKAVSTL